MSEFAIGFVGAGTIARWHAERVTALGQEIVAVADIDPDVRGRFAADFDVDATFDDYERMLADRDLDAVVVAVPNALHADCAVAALEADANVLVEKPLAHSLEGAERIERAAADSDAAAMVGFMKAFASNVETLGAHLADDRFGDVYEVNVEYVRRRGIPQLGSWFTSEEAAGGGVVIDTGPHVLHLALEALEFPAIETVSATTGAHFGSKGEDYTYLSMWGGDPVEGAAFDVEDTARALVRTADGATIHVNCAWASNSESRQYLEVRGDEGGATLDPSDDELRVHSVEYGAISDDTLRTGERDPYRAEWEYFLAVLRGEREHTRNTVAQGVAVQRLIDAIYRSADAGREVELASAADAQAESERAGTD